MQKLLRAAIIAAAAGGAPAFADEGFYGRADTGYGIGGALETPEEDFSVAPTFGGEADLENSWAASGAFGYAFEGGLRIEAEASHRSGDVEETATIDAGAEAQATALMVNAYFDFNPDGGFNPYLGAGIGAARVEARAFNNATLPEDVVGFDADATGFAYQVIGGVGVALTEQLRLDLGYRYFATSELEFDGQGALNADRSFDVDYSHSGAFVGLRWNFSGY
jgi:opacity protein-like surface antigen